MSLAIFLAGYTLGIKSLLWFGDYMSEGVLRTATRQSHVVVALRNDVAVRQALLSSCHADPALPKTNVLASGLLDEVPDGTRMNMRLWGDDPEVGTMTVSEGPLKGRAVWACKGQFALLHAMP
jgi:hypothetical protein